MIAARLRSGAQWSDACILNISSRGMMIHSGRAGPEGSLVELRRGDHVIVARVVWREGGRVGLQSDDRLPVEEILSLNRSSALQLAASDGAIIDRRKRPRAIEPDARSRGRVLEFAGVGAMAAILAIAAWGMAQEAFARPISRAEAALAGQS